MDFLPYPAGRMPKKRTLSRIRDDAAGCRRCDLWKRATQTVFGEGPSSARLMLVGEQPGDQEDLAGEPFVGPAGQLLRESLEAAGLDPAEIFLTNAVKHFKWQPRGKRRIHERPNREEVLACRVWLDEEIEAVRPKMIVGWARLQPPRCSGPRRGSRAIAASFSRQPSRRSCR